MELKNKNILVTGGNGFLGSNVVNEIKKKGNEMSYLDDLQTTGFDQDNDLIGLDDRLNESFNGEAESMAREQAMADMMLGGTEFDWQEMQDYANLVTDVMPEAL